jgi:hypothetical protein
VDRDGDLAVAIRAQVIRAELKSQALALRGQVIRAELRSNEAPSTVRAQVVRAELVSAEAKVVRGQVISATLSSDFTPFMQISDSLTVPSRARVSISSLFRGTGDVLDYEWVCSDPNVVLQPNGRFCVVDLPAVKIPTDFIVQVRGVMAQSVTAFSACAITATRHLVWAGIAGVLQPMGARKFVQGSAPLDPDPNPPPVPDTAAPATPGGFAAAVSGQSVSLTWLASTDNIGIDHYEIYRSSVSGFTISPTTKIADVLTGLDYTDTGVPAGTWYYRILAADAAGNNSPAATQVSAVVTVVGTGTPSPGLWFEKLPSGYGTRKAMPHLFLSPFAINIQNDAAPDYWDRVWLTPALEGTTDYRPSGGYVRDKPLDAYQDARPQPTSTWRAQDAEQMVKQAMDHGLDGFWAELLGPIGSQSQVRNAAAAAAADKLAPDGSFKVACMPDFNNSTWSAQTAAASADQFAVFAVTNPTRGLASYTRRPSGMFLPDGRMLVSCFKGDAMTVAKWQAIFDSMFTGYGVRLALMNVLSTFGNRANFAGFQYGSSSWGAGGDPNIARTMTNQTAISHAAGEKAMVSIWPSDIRPAGNLPRVDPVSGSRNILADAGEPPGTGNVGVYDEALNTEALRAYWEKAISEGADYTQLTTWSDFREGGMSMGTVGQGHVVQAISAWYSYKWKTGAFPAILKDAVIISHRNQPFPTPFTYRYDSSGLYTKKMGHWNRGVNTSPLRNNVEALTFLTAPATVTVRSGATTRTYTAPAGMFADAGLPLAMGTQSVTVTRGGVTVASVTSPVLATNTPFNQNPYYYKASSCELPEWFSKQRDPTANL